MTGYPVGAIKQDDLAQALSEITHLVTQAREAGWDQDFVGEHRALHAARAKLADLDHQLEDRVDELVDDHSHTPHFTADT
uniref:hypothetical protein n=1 Tax=Actinokineospora sp. CA-119265 TaxID=3239890 RepID=UPI003F490E0F